MVVLEGGFVKVVLLFSVFSVVPICSTRVGLYEDSDLVEILDSSNFNEKVLSENTSYVIEFYNAFCGHCIRFSSPWKEFALQVYGNKLFSFHNII